jgi:hypothetical protein
MIRKGIAGSILLVLAAIVSFAQETFTAAASSNKIGIKDQVKVTYTISGSGSLEGFNRPNFVGFEVVGSQQSFNVGHSFSVSFFLQPTQKGIFNFPPAAAKVNGKVIQSNTLAIEVVDGSLMPRNSQQRARQRSSIYDDEDDPFEHARRMMAQMMAENDRAMEEMMRRRQQMLEEYARRRGNPYGQMTEEEIAKNLFVKVEVDKTNPYVGEQINASYKLCTRIGFESASLSKLPLLSGFWSQDYPVPPADRPQVEYINGLPFYVFLIKKTALFPTQSGTLELDPAKIEAVTAMGTRHLSSPVVKINVKPLPLNNKPADYGNAVGQFSASTQLSQTECTTDDVVSLTFTIKGTGNIKLIEQPNIEFDPELGALDPQVADTVTTRSPAIAGRKIFTYNLSPQHPGIYKIPAIKFSYFDPASNAYKTITTEEFTLKVTEGETYRDGAIAAKKLPRDIHPNFIKTPTIVQPKPVFVQQAWYWSAYGLPILSFIGLLAWRKRQDHWQQNVSLYRNKRANKVAWKRLAVARKLLPTLQHNAFYEEISKAIWLYLSDKLSIPIAQLSKENISMVLAEKGVAEHQIAAATNLITECEMALYSPAGGRQQKMQTLDQAVEIITSFENCFKQS